MSVELVLAEESIDFVKARRNRYRKNQYFVIAKLER
jgi:hypothetical protein